MGAGNNDIFQRTPANLKGVFTADAAVLTWGGGVNVGQLVQQLNVQYSQNVTRLFGVGETDQYYVGGRTQGQGNVNRVVGPAGAATVFYTTYGDVCGSPGRNVSFTLQKTNCAPNAAAAQPTTYTMMNVVLTQVGIGVASQDMIIGESLTLMFTTLTAQ